MTVEPDVAAARARADQLWRQSTADLLDLLASTNEALHRWNVPPYCTTAQACDGLATGRWQGRPDLFSLPGVIVVSEARLRRAGARYS